MEKDINVADILKDKPANTRLYSPLFGYVYLLRLSNNIVEVSHHGEPSQFYNNARYFNYHESEPLLFPSKEMRDWSKFAWKKGDVLSCGVDNLCIFEKLANKEYTEFYAKFVTPNYSGNTFKTEKWSKETNEAVIKQYISNIEEFKGGKLNLTTLEIEKQPEFKDGDILVVNERNQMSKGIIIFDEKSQPADFSIQISISAYAFYDVGNNTLTINDEVYVDGRKLRSATDSEKQQLFDALEKEGKAWDADKKAIVKLPKKYEFKPMDYVLVRIKNDKESRWELYQFAYKLQMYYVMIGGEIIDKSIYKFLPYNDQTVHLLGTTDDWKGGEE